MILIIKSEDGFLLQLTLLSEYLLNRVYTHERVGVGIIKIWEEVGLGIYKEKIIFAAS